MSTNRVLDFRSYHKLNEADESGAVSAADQLIDLFIQAYGALVTKIGDYKEAGKDLTEVAKSDNKGQAMLDVITKVAGKVDSKYKEASTQMTVAGRKLKDAYETLLKTEEGAEDKIKDKIYQKTIDYITQLGKTANDAPEVKESNNFGSEEQDHLYLFEKNTFTDERQEIVKKIVPIFAQVTYLANNSPIKSLKDECVKIGKELQGYYDILNKEEEWEKMKRKERKDKLAEILGKIAEIPTRMQEIQTKALVKIGIESKVQNSIKAAMDIINKAMETLSKEEETQIADNAGEGEEDKKEEDKKEEDKKDEKSYEEIKSGNVDKENLSKKGKNLDVIKEYQEKINKIIPEKRRIAADGLYGKDTENAIVKISFKYGDLVPEIKGLDGKSMTPAFIKFINKYEENKDKIKELFK
jgi:hypothetical protein